VTPEGRFDADRLDAVLFDLDGVLTDTAGLHAALPISGDGARVP